MSEKLKETQLKQALEAGEKSGVIQNFNPVQNLNDLHHKHL